MSYRDYVLLVLGVLVTTLGILFIYLGFLVTNRRVVRPNDLPQGIENANWFWIVGEPPVDTRLIDDSVDDEYFFPNEQFLPVYVGSVQSITGAPIEKLDLTIDKHSMEIEYVWNQTSGDEMRVARHEWPSRIRSGLATSTAVMADIPRRYLPEYSESDLHKAIPLSISAVVSHAASTAPIPGFRVKRSTLTNSGTIGVISFEDAIYLHEKKFRNGGIVIAVVGVVCCPMGAFCIWSAWRKSKR